MYFKSVAFVEQRACVCVCVCVERGKGKGENAWRDGEGVNAKINETEISFLIHFSISLFCFPYSLPFYARISVDLRTSAAFRELLVATAT